MKIGALMIAGLLLWACAKDAPAGRDVALDPTIEAYMRWCTVEVRQAMKDQRRQPHHSGLQRWFLVEAHQHPEEEKELFAEVFCRARFFDCLQEIRENKPPFVTCPGGREEK